MAISQVTISIMSKLICRYDSFFAVIGSRTYGRTVIREKIPFSNQRQMLCQELKEADNVGGKIE